MVLGRALCERVESESAKSAEVKAQQSESAKSAQVKVQAA